MIRIFVFIVILLYSFSLTILFLLWELFLGFGFNKTSEYYHYFKWDLKYGWNNLNSN